MTAEVRVYQPRISDEDMKSREVVLRVENLHVHFETNRGTVKAVNGVDFELRAGERFGLVGESGSGKSTMALALMRMIRSPGHIPEGKMILGDRDITNVSEREMRQIRMARIAMIPQGAMNSLNPVMRIKQQIADGIEAHGGWRGGSMDSRIAELLNMVGLRREVADRYPHELSGGMKQRVCIAMAISLQPSVIIADEPTSALDVIVQRQVMQTLANVQKQIGAAVLLIGHDMGLMAQFVDRLGVMYGGKLMEVGPTREMFHNPEHPYTQALIDSLPSLERTTKFVPVKGAPHSPLAPPSGCVFHPRCPKVMPHCPEIVPLPVATGPERRVACLLYGDGRTPVGAVKIGETESSR